MTKRQELIIKDLLKIKKFLTNIKFVGNAPDELFSCRIAQPKHNDYIYKTNHSRWFITANFSDKRFELLNKDLWYDEELEKYRSYKESFPLDITERDLKWMDKDELSDEFFLYAEGLIEHWSYIKSKLVAFFEYEKKFNKIKLLEKFSA